MLPGLKVCTTKSKIEPIFTSRSPGQAVKVQKRPAKGGNRQIGTKCLFEYGLNNQISETLDEFPWIDHYIFHQFRFVSAVAMLELT